MTEAFHPSPIFLIGILGILLGLYLLGALSFSKPIGLLLILACIFPFMAMIIGNVRKILIAFIIIDIALNLDFNLLYDHQAAEIGAIGGFSISITTICLLALYGLWIGRIFIGIDLIPPYLLKMSWPPIVFLTSVILSALTAQNALFSLFEIALLSQMLLLYIYIVGTVRTRDDLIFILTIFLLTLFFESLIMIALRLMGTGFKFAGITARISADSLRVGGTVGAPVDAASYLQLMLVPTISIFLAKTGKLLKSLAVTDIILGSVCLILTKTRGGWIAFGISVFILLVFAWRYGWLSPKIIVGITVGMILIPLIFEEIILDRFFGDDFGSAQSRIPLIALAMKIIQDNLLLGVGANNFSLVVDEYASKGFINAWIYVVHNKYLLVAAETGLVGLFAFIWLLFASIYRGWQGLQLNDRLLAPISLGLTAALLGHMTHWLVDVFHSRPQMQIFWIIIALIAAIRNMDQST